MKHGPYLLINLLLVAGGIFIYDTLWRDATDLSRGGRMSNELATSSEPGSATDAAPREDIEAFVQETLTRLQVLEEVLGDIRRTAGSAPRAAARHEPPAAPTAGTLPGLDPEHPLDPEGRRFDEKAIETLRAYLAEIDRRKHVEAQRRLVESELTRQDLGLTPSEQDAVVETTIEYRGRVVDLMRKRWARGEKGRAERAVAFENLRAGYRADLDRLVSADGVERIMSSSIAPGRSAPSGARGGSDTDR